MMNDKAYEIIVELFSSFKNRYQINLEWRGGSQFVFDYVHLLYYQSHKTNPSHGGYTVTVALNHEEIGKNPERMTKKSTFMNTL